jgi:hypothetical protein
LPAKIFDFPDDKGIDYISYDYTIGDKYPAFTSVTFTRTTHAKSRRLYWTEEEKPAPDNPYFLFDKDKVYLLGIEKIDIRNVEVCLYTSFDTDLNGIDLDSEFDFPVELLPVLQKYLLDIGRFGLLMPREIENDGASEMEGKVPTQKIIPVQQSVNPQDVQQNTNEQ